MRTKIIFLLTQCLLTLALNPSFAQDIHYYGSDTTYHYKPTDIIATQNGDLVLVAAINYRSNFPRNYYFKRFLARIRPNGDTVWTREHLHTRYQASLSEKTDGSLMVWGNIDGTIICNGVSSNYPYGDQSIHTYTANGVTSSEVQYDESCEDAFLGIKKRADGGILTTTRDGFSPNQAYFIKELSPTGQRSSLPYPMNVAGAALLEKNNTGYWLMQSDTLYRLDLAGNVRWQQQLSIASNYLNQFIRVAEDSLLVASRAAGQTSDFTQLTKCDSTGIEDWTVTVPLGFNDILLHSSGNYVLTGMFQQKYRVMVMSPDGDSLWSRTIDFNKAIQVYKTIETNDGRIATLAEENINYRFNYLARAIVVVDTIPGIPLHNSIQRLTPSLAASCYPNPTAGQVKIDIQEPNNQEYQVAITSLLGQVVLTQSFAYPSFSLGVGQLPKGLYLVTITSSSGAIFEEKLVVSN